MTQSEDELREKTVQEALLLLW